MDMTSLKEMVDTLSAEGYIHTERVKEAMLSIDRRDFIDELLSNEPYVDTPLYIGEGQTISAPHMVAIMLELSEINETSKILEIGTGSGYNAALLSFLANRGAVFTIETNRVIYNRAVLNLSKCKYAKNVVTLLGDGSQGYEKNSPYDRIVVTCAVPSVPEPLINQLSDNGRMVIPVGSMDYQRLYLIEKNSNKIKKSIMADVIFVPLIGKFGFK
ncbi:MAG: protein-L-isoaspartate O-methyltransferase [Candidatus Thermoplasmatota archaeon]|jgi:protein-L-isoaspartate(D-aspartate) O-methyltransferase|nr:protein-L-isoaspartate O-methyltransferase [Candidatus Thermoplasmatota archaeon]